MIEIVYFSDLPFVNSSQGHQIRNKREYFEDIMLDMRGISTFRHLWCIVQTYASALFSKQQIFGYHFSEFIMITCHRTSEDLVFDVKYVFFIFLSM